MSQEAPVHLFADVLARVLAACRALVDDGVLPDGLDLSRIVVEPPKDAAHGDMASNAAMVLAKDARKKPRDLADALAERLRADPLIAKVEIAGPGFLNLTLQPQAWADALRAILTQGKDYGRSRLGRGEKVNVEYVSANPTGPMHVGHCRGAVFGDALASLLDFSGHDVTREYYINDAGAQVDVLARSAYLRYREALGEDIGEIPEGLYPGDYLKPVGILLAAAFSTDLLNQTEYEWMPIVRQATVEAMLVRILEDLAKLHIEFDVFFSEKGLSEAVLKFEPESGATFYCAKTSFDLMNGPAWGVRSYFTKRAFERNPKGGVTVGFSESLPDGPLGESDYLGRALDALKGAGQIYLGRLPPPKGAPVEDYEDREQTLFRATAYGDDVDRPLLKSDGGYTYFASDIAYHKTKFDRGFKNLVDVWGADHGGYVKRMQAAVKAITGGEAVLDVKLIQLVRLLRAGEPVKMSKRSGDFVTLREVVDEVGKDAVRFMMLFRKNDALLDFDLAKVREQSKDNPVFYVQYGHARGHSIFRNAREALPGLPDTTAARAGFLSSARLERLNDPAELALLRRLALYPRLIESAALAHEPHRVAFYLYDLASEFHAHWTHGRDAPHLRFIINDDREVTEARLAMVQGIVSVLESGLALLGVEAPVEMR